MEFKLIFCCLLGITSVYGEGFYFPDEVHAKAQSNSGAWTDGQGNSHANANSNAAASNAPRYPHFYKPSGHERPHEFAEYNHQFGYNPEYNRPLPPYKPNPYPVQNIGQSQSSANAQANSHGFGGNSNAQANSKGFGGNSQSNALANSQGFGGNSQSNAQSNAQNLGGNSLSNAIAGSQSLGPCGEASAASAAAAAGTSFVNGIPIASAAAASSASSTGSHGAGSSSSANAGGNRAPHYYSGFNRPYDNFGNQKQPWFYRSAGSDDDDVKDTVSSSTDTKIVFDD